MNKISKFKIQISNSKGFTLIEILVAMTIVAVLMAISLVSLSGARKVARDGKRKADLEQIRSALEIYRSDVGAYPDSLTFGGSLTASGNTYLDLVPNDSITTYSYKYNYISENSYSLCAFLEAGGTAGACGSESCGTGIVCNYKVTNY